MDKYPGNSKSKQILAVLSIAQFFGLALWFAPNAVIDQMKGEFGLTNNDISNLSISVTLGFVVGGFIFSIFNIPDIMAPKNFFFVSTIGGGVANIWIATLSEVNLNLLLLLRFLTGVCLAGIYPIGMKLTASHFKENRGLAIGILLSALTAGSGLPYLFRLYGSPDWQFVFNISSLLAILGGLLVFLLVTTGPYVGPKQSFSINAVRTVYSKKSVRYANFGYFGHMWELYAMWIWIPIMLRESYVAANLNTSENEAITFMATGTFLIFLLGAVANIFGGHIADNIGRTKFNIIMLSISGLSGLIIGFFFSNPYLVLVIGIIWGITIIPDSPQYSTMITELSDQSLVGSALTMQTAVGFSLTIISIKLVPYVQEIGGWKYAFTFLSLGPLIGIYAMWKLRLEPDANLIAQGRL